MVDSDVRKVELLLPSSVQRKFRRVGYPLSCILLFTNDKSALNQTGWFDSLREMVPVGPNNEPIPWLTYPTIEFLNERLDHCNSLFEYGSGNSTKWFASRVDRVVSLEHDTEWYDHVSSDLPDGASVKLESKKEDYVSAIDDCGNSAGFDIVLIDGKWRNECAEYALENLSESGVIILDDSSRDVYEPTKELLCDEGFKMLEFTGMVSLSLTRSNTAIFYRDENCLGI